MYDGVMGAEIMSIANPELKWQTTLNRNIGLEFSLLQGLWNPWISPLPKYNKEQFDGYCDFTFYRFLYL